MTRVLKPGGQIVIATWCQRDEGNKPFDEEVRLFCMYVCMHVCMYGFKFTNFQFGNAEKLS